MTRVTLGAEMAHTVLRDYNGVRFLQGRHRRGHPTTTTQDEVKPSATPAIPGSNNPAYAGLPGNRRNRQTQPTRDPDVVG